MLKRDFRIIIPNKLRLKSVETTHKINEAFGNETLMKRIV